MEPRSPDPAHNEARPAPKFRVDLPPELEGAMEGPFVPFDPDDLEARLAALYEDEDAPE